MSGGGQGCGWGAGQPPGPDLEEYKAVRQSSVAKLL